MASIRKKTNKHPKNGKPSYSWQVMWRDPEGKQRAKNFPREKDAKAFAASVETDKDRGSYTDPNAGRMTLKAFATEWLEAQTFTEGTREATELRLRLHIFPSLGAKPLAAIKPSDVQRVIKLLSATLAPAYVRTILANLSTVLTAAVDDGRIAKNPAKASSVQAPKQNAPRARVWPLRDVAAVHVEIPVRYKIAVTLAARCGLRQGEIFGLAVSDVDFLRGVIHVRRQVKIVGSRLVYGLPKGGKVRDVPLPESVGNELAACLQAFPAKPVTLPMDSPTGKPVTADLILTSREGKAMNRNYFNPFLWKPSLKAAGIEATRDNGMHVLRHTYASVLLQAGESIKVVSEYLGHSDAGFTLRTYTHLMPDSDARARQAIDQAFSTAAVDPALTPGLLRAAE